MNADTTTTALAITPGGYLRKRREAAELSVAAVAMLCVSSPIALSAAIAAIEDAEADRSILRYADLARLTDAFRFVPGIYLAIAQELPFPSLCRVCACSWDDPCEHTPGIGCSWTDADETLCTSCQRRMS